MPPHSNTRQHPQQRLNGQQRINELAPNDQDTGSSPHSAASRAEQRDTGDLKRHLTGLSKALGDLVKDVNSQITSAERTKVSAHTAAKSAASTGSVAARRAAEEAMHVAMSLLDKLENTASDLHRAQMGLMRAIGRT